jgi:OOP family OmpA-OmpF porin
VEILGTEEHSVGRVIVNNRGMFSSRVAKIEKGISFIGVTALFTAALTMAPPAAAQDTAVTVQLTSPVSAGSAHKGDIVTGRVTSPDSLKGDTIQGKVTQANASRGQAMLQFTFESLRHGSVIIAITADIQGISNSKGQQGVDDQGRPLLATNVAAKGPTQSKVSRFGGLLGGNAGAAASSAPDTAGTPASMQIAAQGPNLELGASATIIVSARSNGGPDLASLAPNAPASAAAPSPASTPASAAPSTATASTTASAQSVNAGGAGGQPDLRSAKIDFIPGERTVFFDDISDMAVDEPPPHWKVRGDAVELRTGGGVHQLTITGHSQLTSASIAFPENFTFEVDEVFSPQTTTWPNVDWAFQNKDGDIMASLETGARLEDHLLVFGANDSKCHLGGKDVPDIDFTQPVHVAFWVQNKRIRVYVNGDRVLDVNETNVPPISQIYAEFNGGAPAADVGIRRVRVAESTPDFSTVIASAGKYVTHGINFDTNSDRLKPESAPILKQVAAGLDKNPNLKLEIDGYTDSVGDAAHNLDLSKRRAEAVRTVLVSQFGIDAARLTSNGFGQAKPIGSNDTPDGRAQNRRVEFVKQ